jgi:hypothetical protein
MVLLEKEYLKNQEELVCLARKKGRAITINVFEEEEGWRA